MSVVDDARFAFGAFESLLDDALRTRTPERLRSELAAGCWIYGAGQYGQKIGGLLKAQGYRIEGFIDRRAGADLGALGRVPGPPWRARNQSDGSSRVLTQAWTAAACRRGNRWSLRASAPGPCAAASSRPAMKLK